MVIAGNFSEFAAAFGSSVPVAGVFPGNLSNAGEILSLLLPGETPRLNVTVDQVAYGTSAPWPIYADGHGGSLQQLDPAQDHNSPFNWTDGTHNLPPEFKRISYPPTSGRLNLSLEKQPGSNLPPITNSLPVAFKLPSIPQVRINEVQSENLSSITNRFGEAAPWIEWTSRTHRRGGNLCQFSIGPHQWPSLPLVGGQRPLVGD